MRSGGLWLVLNKTVFCPAQTPNLAHISTNKRAMQKKSRLRERESEIGRKQWRDSYQKVQPLIL